ncbi:MAG: hypothetical protein K9L82_13200 [Chromatiaceae bacterium]|nr:hypothetical protein [Chromatiaceae bacterium]MCF7993541.1 hypothetical protein [Chromatiaceae bacterium]MCF8014475.1 hypothetical protein [Chromatiaceae bacterium]
MTPLRQYLADQPAAEQIGVFDAGLETLPTRFTISVGAARDPTKVAGKGRRFSLSRALGSPKSPIIFVGTLVFFFLVGVVGEIVAEGKLSTSQLVGALAFLLIAAVLVWPLVFKRHRGLLNWSRQVDLTSE